MIPDMQRVSIYIRPGVTDMRKQANGLAVVVQDLMGQDPGSGSLYLFCNRQRKLLKCLWWETNGFWLFQKRLESGLFPWPSSRQQAQSITGEQLSLLLAGIDFWKAHKSVQYKYVV